MTVHGVLVDADGAIFDEDAHRQLRELAAIRPVALVTSGPLEPAVATSLDVVSFVLDASTIGLDRRDPRLVTMAAAGFACHPNEIAAVSADPLGDPRTAQRVGGRGIWLDGSGSKPPRGAHPDATVASFAEVADVLRRLDEEDARAAHRVGVGPHPLPHPDDDHLDPELLARGDRRNVVDRYRYWREEAVVADLARRARPFHVAVENWRRDRNIGTVVRNANGFGAAGVHIVGPRRWNRRGAMATDRYLDVRQHESIDDFVDTVRSLGLSIVAVDNVEGSVPIETADLPERCVLVFGQEGPGITPELLERADLAVAITQRGSTRSLNAGVAAGIAMYAWSRNHPAPAD